MRHNVFTFFSHYNCLDEEFDGYDAEADYEFCQAIIAGRAGQHPDAWGCGETSLTAVMPLGFSGYERPFELDPYERVYHPSPADLKAAKHWPRPVKEPQPKSAWHPHTPTGSIGTVKLNCDDCGTDFRQTANYGAGRRNAAAAMLRQMGRSDGWTHIAGRDRCPACSFIPPEPLDVDQRGVV